jgi:hypothetical protein
MPVHGNGPNKVQQTISRPNGRPRYFLFSCFFFFQLINVFVYLQLNTSQQKPVQANEGPQKPMLSTDQQETHECQCRPPMTNLTTCSLDICFLMVYKTFRLGVSSPVYNQLKHYQFIATISFTPLCYNSAYSDIGLDTSLLMDHPDPYSWVFLCQKFKLRSIQVCSHEWSGSVGQNLQVPMSFTSTCRMQIFISICSFTCVHL